MGLCKRRGEKKGRVARVKSLDMEGGNVILQYRIRWNRNLIANNLTVEEIKT